MPATNRNDTTTSDLMLPPPWREFQYKPSDSRDHRSQYSDLILRWKFKFHEYPRICLRISSVISTTMEQTKHITQSGTKNNFHYKGMASPTNRPTLLICTSDSYTLCSDCHWWNPIIPSHSWVRNCSEQLTNIQVPIAFASPSTSQNQATCRWS